jgi:hypothetical protein
MPTHTYTRRAILDNLFRVTACSAIGLPTLNAVAQSEFGGPYQQRRGLGQYTQGFQRQYRVPAMSVAISKGGRFVYDRAGGMGDRKDMMQAQQDTLFASLICPNRSPRSRSSRSYKQANSISMTRSSVLQGYLAQNTVRFHISPTSRMLLSTTS